MEGSQPKAECSLANSSGYCSQQRFIRFETGPGRDARDGGIQGLFQKKAFSVRPSLILFVLGTFDFLENRFIDWRFLIRGEIDADPRIVIVSIDEDSFSELNERWPWSRTHFARLIDRLSREGAKIIGFDIIMSEPYPGDQDEQLARSARMFGNVVFPSKFEETTRRIRWKGKEVELKGEEFKGPIESISESGDVGYLSLPHDSDGFVRRFTPIRSYQGELYASFDLKVTARYLGTIKSYAANSRRISLKKRSFW